MTHYLKFTFLFTSLLYYMQCNAQELNFDTFVPLGFSVTEKIFGDLNKDGQDDCVLLIKGT